MRLEVKDLRYGYTQAREVVKGVSFTAQAGECLAVLGVNGVGKTTMLKCINRIIRPSSGEVLVDGVPVGKLGGRRWPSRSAMCPRGVSSRTARCLTPSSWGESPLSSGT